MGDESSKADYVAYRDRWKRFEEYEQAELRRTPLSLKLRQLAACMASARRFPRTEDSRAEEAEMRERWNRLRRAHVD